MRIKEYLEQLEDKVRKLEKDVAALKAKKAAQAEAPEKAAAPKAKKTTK